MPGLFGTLELARRGMAAQMAGVQVAGQNLANVNTPGYSRLRVTLSATPDAHGENGAEGTGVQAVNIQRVVDDVLNGRIVSQASLQSYWTAQQTALTSAQTSLNEFLDGTGSTDTSSVSTIASTANASLSSQLSNFFNAAQALTQPQGNTATNRSQLVAAAQSLALTFNDVNSRLADTRSDINTMVSNDTNSANGLLAKIAELNHQITAAQIAGESPNTLLDQRDQKLQELGKLVNFTTSNSANGALNIIVDGQTLVNGTAVADTLQTYDAGGGQILIRTATGGVNLSPTSGSIAGEITARDTTLANLQNNLDTLAGTFITQVNAVHATGFTISGTSGNNFFNGTNAGTMSVNSALTTNSALLQISGSATAANDISIARAIAQLQDASQTALGGQTFSQQYTSSVASFGTDLKTANDAVDSQAKVTSLLSAQRDAVSGVSVDEEMTTLLAFQRAYSASASVLKTVDEMIQTTLGLKS